MKSRSRRSALVVAIAVLAIGGVWWFTRAAPDVEREEAEERVASIDRAPAELAGAPPSRRLPKPEAGCRGTSGSEPSARSETGVVHRVRIKLADGTDAPSGNVFCRQGLVVRGERRPVEVIGHRLVRAEIHPGAPVELAFEAGFDPGRLLVVDVPGRPVHVVEVADVWPGELVVPDGLVVEGVVTLADGSPVAELALAALEVDDTLSRDWYFSGDDVDLSRRIETSRFGPRSIHAETRTDGFGRFQLRLASGAGSSFAWMCFVSRDPVWFVRPRQFRIDLRQVSSTPLHVVVDPGVALDVHVVERTTGEALPGAYLRCTYPLPFGGVVTGFELPREPRPQTRIYLPRVVAASDSLSIEVICTVSAAGARGRVPTRTTVAIPAGVAVATVELRMEPEFAEADKAHVELQLPDRGDGVAGEYTPWSLEMLFDGDHPFRADILDTTTWAAPGRIDADLAPGTWRLRLLPNNRTRPAYETRATLVSRVTSRLVLTKLESQLESSSGEGGRVRLRAGPHATVTRVGVRGRTGDWYQTLDGADALVSSIPAGEYSLIVKAPGDGPESWRVVRPITVREGEETLVVVDE